MHVRRRRPGCIAACALGGSSSEKVQGSTLEGVGRAHEARHVKRDTLLDVFADFAELPDPFLIYDDGLRIHRHSYRETAAAAQALAWRLREAGVTHGDRVLIWSEN